MDPTLKTTLSEIETRLIQAMQTPAAALKPAVAPPKTAPIAKSKPPLKRKPLAHTEKRERISIRITSQNKWLLQQKARQMGLPYQTLAASILRQYAMGQLQNKP